MEAKREREEEGRRKEGEERRRSKCIASKNKNPTLRMWGMRNGKFPIYPYIFLYIPNEDVGNETVHSRRTPVHC